jgi:cGMP-dependent protein kinase
VISQGEEGNHFYVVESGTLDIWVSTQGGPALKYGSLTAGMGFGELALMCNTPRAATIRTTSRVTLWSIDRIVFRDICTRYQSLRHEKAVQFLRSVSVFDKLTHAELVKVASAMQWEEFVPGTVLFREGEVGEHFYLITSGSVVVSRKDVASGDDIHVKELTTGHYFGEMALLKDETRSATCTCVTAVQLLTLEREQFTVMLGNLQELLDRHPVPRSLSSATAASPDNERMMMMMDAQVGTTQDSTKTTLQTSGSHHDTASFEYKLDIAFSDLEILQALGAGAFGHVKLVRHRPDGRTFALKCLVKSHIVANNLKDHVVNEKRVMMRLNHPFLLKLHHTYKDKSFLYLLLEVCLGGELFTHLRRREKFEEPAARFYVASVLLAFQHMHQHAIAYRDLKPENLILDARGFLKVRHRIVLDRSMDGRETGGVNVNDVSWSDIPSTRYRIDNIETCLGEYRSIDRSIFPWEALNETSSP